MMPWNEKMQNYVDELSDWVAAVNDLFFFSLGYIFWTWDRARITAIFQSPILI